MKKPVTKPTPPRTLDVKELGRVHGGALNTYISETVGQKTGG